MGPSDKASKQAQAAEAQRQAAISGTQASVNSVFDSPERAADIADYVGALRDYYGEDLDRQYANTNRQLKFALARSGQIGGSVQNDKAKEVSEDYARGMLQVDRKARGAGAELQAADQDARARLIALATSGLDKTTGARMAADSLRSNIESGRSAAQLQGLGDVFGGGLSEYFQQVSDAKARRDANQAAGFGLYQPTGGFAYGGGR